MSLLARLGVLLVAMGALLAMGPGPGPAAAATIDVNAGDFWFCNSSHQGNVCTTTISVGDTVTWHFSSAGIDHTTTSNTAIWNSGKVANGGTFSHTFSSPGTFAYVCNNHPTFMMGQIVVNAPSVGGIAQLPAAAKEPLNGATSSSSSSSVGLIAGSAAIAAGIVALGGAAWYARRRRVS
jgi:plastocyanin